MKKYLNVFIIAIVAIAFYLLNASLPFVMDDALYAHIYPANPIDNGQPHCLNVNDEIHTFGDVLESQWNHYFTKNGRGLTHIFVQTFCGILGKPLYNIITTLIFIIFVILMNRMFCPWIKKETIGLVYVFPLVLFFLLIPEPTCLWDGIAYGVNYLWASTWILTFSYIIMERDTSQKPNRRLMLVGCIVAVLAGWSHEGLVIPLGAALLWYACQRKLRLKSFEWIWLSLFAIAAMLLVFAPSNFSRASGMNESDWAGGALMLRMRAFIFVRGFYVLIIAALLLLIKNRKCFVAFVKNNQCWIFAWVVSLSFIILVGALNARSTYGIDFFSILLLCRLIGYFTLSENKNRFFVYCTSALLIAGLCNVVFWQYKAGRQYCEIDKYLEASASPDALAVVDPVNVPYLLKRYVARYKFEEPWEYWEPLVLSFRNSKNQVIISASGNSTRSIQLKELMDACHKVPGDNPFFKIGNYVVTIEPQQESVSMVWHLGKYQAYDVISAVKKVVSMFRGVATSEMVVELPVKHIVFQDRDYWYFEMYPKQSREILSMDMN